jgi:hypothetical protein
MIYCPVLQQPALPVRGRHRPARLRVIRRLLGFGQQLLLVTSPFVRRADLVREVRLHRRVPDSVVRCLCLVCFLLLFTRRFARRRWPVR